MDDYIKTVRGARFSSMPAGSAKHSAPQPGDVRPPLPRPPAAPTQVVHMPTKLPVLGPATFVYTPHPQPQPGQPAPLADGVVRVRVQQHRDHDGKLVLKSAIIYCPGCKFIHSLPLRSTLDPGWRHAASYANKTWEWDGSEVAPTFSPSLRYYHTRPDKTEQTDCHTFIKGGHIQFLDDSAAHKLRGWHELPAMKPLDAED